MHIRIIDAPIGKVAMVHSDEIIIKDGSSALDYAVAMGYEHNCWASVINKSAIATDFFKLSTGVAGEVTQKFVNYRFRLAIVGDFSAYTSPSLRDFMYECNQGRYLYFATDEDAALRLLIG